MGLEGSETVLGASSLKVAATLTTSRLDNLQLTVERVTVYLGCDIEDAGVGFVIASELGCQASIIHTAGQVHSLVIRR
jgi:hypothetical protein